MTAVRGLASVPDPRIHRNVKAMSGNWSGSYRMRVGEYRVIFKLIDEEAEEKSLLIFVTHVGSRGGIY